MVSGTSCCNYCGYELAVDYGTASLLMQLMITVNVFNRRQARDNCTDAAAFRSVTDISKQKSPLQLCACVWT